MKKNVWKSGGAILAILIIGFFALSLSLDGIIKSNIQNTGTALLKTDVEVNNVSLSILDGEGAIDGLIIHNPEGFEDRPAIQFKQITLQINLSTLLSDTLIVKNIVVQEPELYVEQTMEGNNLKTIQNSLEASSSAGTTSTHLVIDHLLINKASIALNSKIGEGRTISTEIDKLELSGVGKQGNNTVAQTANQILEPMVERAIRKAASEGLKNAVKGTLHDLING